LICDIKTSKQDMTFLTLGKNQEKRSHKQLQNKSTNYINDQDRKNIKKIITLDKKVPNLLFVDHKAYSIKSQLTIDSNYFDTEISYEK